MTQQLILDTPVGRLGITASGEAVTRIVFCDTPRGAKGSVRRNPTIKECSAAEASPLLKQAAEELSEYFAGTRREFTTPLTPVGTPFQQAVWEALRTIPYGQTRTYKQIAEQVGRPSACRAVGMANNRNPIPVIIPCHRVVGSNGALVGYAGGLTVKQTLLELEK